jgi:mxaD protein
VSDDINDFDDLNEWRSVVAGPEMIKRGEYNRSGAVRLLTLGDGGTIKEELMAYDDAGMSYTYKILGGVLNNRR